MPINNFLFISFKVAYRFSVKQDWLMHSMMREAKIPRCFLFGVEFIDWFSLVQSSANR